MTEHCTGWKDLGARNSWFGQKRRIKRLPKGFLVDQAHFPDYLRDRLFLLKRLLYNLGRFLIADDRIERGRERWRSLGVMAAAVLVRLDSADAVIGEGVEGICEYLE